MISGGCCLEIFTTTRALISCRLIELKQERIFRGQVDIVVRNQVQGVHQNKGQVLVFYGLKPQEGGPFSMVEQEVTGPLRKTDDPFRQAEDLLLFYGYRAETAGFNLQRLISLFWSNSTER